MYGDNAATSRTLCRSVSKRIGDRRPISAYLPATGIERREEINFAIGPRRIPSGPRGIMSGSRNRFSRKGSTASSESGPPSWKRTIPTRFFPAKSLSPVDGLLQALEIVAQRGCASCDAQIINEKHGPADQIGR